MSAYRMKGEIEYRCGCVHGWTGLNTDWLPAAGEGWTCNVHGDTEVLKATRVSL